MIELIVADEHSPLYDLWRERGYRNLSVCHVDFHCDMRGLLIDRKQESTLCLAKRSFMNRIDSGSFLAHAIMNGIVTGLRWVHDDFGGRKYDELYCVKYETDFTALPFLLMDRQSWNITRLLLNRHLPIGMDLFRANISVSIGTASHMPIMTRTISGVSYGRNIRT